MNSDPPEIYSFFWHITFFTKHKRLEDFSLDILSFFYYQRVSSFCRFVIYRFGPFKEGEEGLRLEVLVEFEEEITYSDMCGQDARNLLKIYEKDIVNYTFVPKVGASAKTFIEQFINKSYVDLKDIYWFGIPTLGTKSALKFIYDFVFKNKALNSGHFPLVWRKLLIEDEKFMPGFTDKVRLNQIESFSFFNKIYPIQYKEEDYPVTEEMEKDYDLSRFTFLSYLYSHNDLKFFYDLLFVKEGRNMLLHINDCDLLVESFILFFEDIVYKEVMNSIPLIEGQVLGFRELNIFYPKKFKYFFSTPELFLVDNWDLNWLLTRELFSCFMSLALENKDLRDPDSITKCYRYAFDLSFIDDDEIFYDVAERLLSEKIKYQKRIAKNILFLLYYYT